MTDFELLKATLPFGGKDEREFGETKKTMVLAEVLGE